MSTSRKIKDIQPGRIVELAETETEKATAILVTEVTRYTKTVDVTGKKLTRGGKAHPSGKTHTYSLVGRKFIVKLDDVEAPAVVAAEVESPVE